MASPGRPWKARSKMAVMRAWITSVLFTMGTRAVVSAGWPTSAKTSVMPRHSRTTRHLAGRRPAPGAGGPCLRDQRSRCHSTRIGEARAVPQDRGRRLRAATALSQELALSERPDHSRCKVVAAMPPFAKPQFLLIPRQEGCGSTVAVGSRNRRDHIIDSDISWSQIIRPSDKFAPGEASDSSRPAKLSWARLEGRDVFSQSAVLRCSGTTPQGDSLMAKGMCRFAGQLHARRVQDGLPGGMPAGAGCCQRRSRAGSYRRAARGSGHADRLRAA